MVAGDQFVAQATTNTTPGSVVQVYVENLVCSLTIEQNEFGDTLPIIPTESRVSNNKVLYRLKLKAKLTRHGNGQPESNHALDFITNREPDSITSRRVTDANGELLLTLETREAGELEIKTTTEGVTLPVFKLNLKEAWYQSKFLITGYHVCAEEDFSGPLVDGLGLSERHKEDFLYSARGVPMQGTGKATNGRYIKLKNLQGGWHRNERGNRDRVNNPESVSFMYSEDGVSGSFGNVSENKSMAVDTDIIPEKAKVNIDGVGDRFADDTGNAIRDYHIDVFLGAGRIVFTEWLRGGIDNTRRKVKYIGD